MTSLYINQCLNELSARTESKDLVQICEKFKNELQNNKISESSVLKYLSKRLKNSKDTAVIGKCFTKVILQLVSKIIPLKPFVKKVDIPEPNDESSRLEHLDNCIVFGILAGHPDILQYSLKYFKLNDVAPFEVDIDAADEIPTTPKKAKRQKVNKQQLEYNMVSCCHQLLKSAPFEFSSRWNWSLFIYQFHDSENVEIKCLVKECIVILTGMTEVQADNLSNKLGISADNSIEWTLKSNGLEQIEKELTQNDNSAEPVNIDAKNVINIDGIMLSVYDEYNVKAGPLIPVKSTLDNLKSVSLAIASGKAVCLMGPVGSGKTALVEHLASITGRKGTAFRKVQLGDQTDSRMLLGTYQCTDIPGEFVWRPGVLTEAVQDGHWLLLEDIDCAALDVASVLSSLLERNILSVPGYRDSLQVAPGFQLFLTQRTVATIYGYQKRTTNASTLLQKHWTQINVEPLSRSELIDIVQKIYPQLTTIADRMIQVFMMFSVGSHDSSLQNTSEADENSTSLVKLNFRYGRLISTRDLMKWCLRTIVNFDVSSPESALKVLQDAIDIFTCSIPDPLLRLDLAKKISTQLGIVETRSEYFCKTYKPTISLNPCQCSFGRAVVQRKEVALTDLSLNKGRTVFSFTRPSTCLLERIACCVVAHEPVLLVGETGTGKTSSVQYLAKQAGHKLIVINMNQQSDSADLLGGFKPVDMKFVITPVRNEFEELFMSYFDSAKNTKFLQHIYNCYSRGEWSILVTLMKQTQKAAMKRLVKETNVKTHAEFFLRWQGIGLKLNKLELQIKAASSLTFAFIEGSLIKAMQKGDWVLLDEINLASAEILECLSGLLDDSVELIEKGDKIPIKKHEDFTLFACMNPATDVGKKELPVGLRNRFTEFFVDELVDRNDLILLVGDYLYNMNLSGNILDAIYLFYTKVKKEASLTLVDGAGHAPHYSLRTLCRALSAAAKANCGTLARSLYESFCLSFLTQLDSRSHPVVEAMIAKAVLGKKGLKAVMNQPIPEPVSKNQTYLLFEGHWIPQGKNPITIQDGYVLTPTVRKNLRDIARIISLGQLPVLLQGDTSVGKTSLILYIARASGNQCVRINNHEHTDLQEYVGSYATDTNGKLVFKEGVLVEAMRKGYWIILDELNLAPSDVLEALNRVLDDNRELYIPETQETVKAHANFMLFATQNPPGLYGGRKMLSRAFRNRFVELHFDEIPRVELETILHKRCHMPMSYCKKMISVMAELQLRRRGSAAVQGKDGFITLRDLFRWGQRYKLAAKDTQREGTYYDWDQHIADEGYLVLAGKVRQVDERDIIREVLQKHIKRVVDPNNLFTLSESTSTVTKTILESILNNPLEQFVHIVWTYNMRRLAVLIAKSFIFVEPVLLVGETGCGKTTICQVLAALNKSTLLSVNCHMHTESSDFLGGLRPARDKSDGKLFEWIDGPLIIAMRQGYMFLSDEISLADDSVLERLNSLLEPERQLLLAEKGSDSEGDSVTVTATEGFHFIGTMNPGGDYGKKELSPALRNRFTEIWCDNVSSREDLLQVLERSVSKEFSFGNQEDDTSGIGKSILDFVDWLKKSEISRRFPCSIRDLLSWVNFINATVSKNLLNIPEAYVHGACLTFLDCFGTALTGHVEPKELNYLKLKAIDFLFNQIKNIDDNNLDHLRDMLSNRKCPYTAQLVDGTFGIKPFFIPIGTKLQDMDIDISQSSYNKNDELKFTFTAPTTGGNTLRLLRGLQLNKAILLEGNPGVGKTSLVTALAKASGHNIVRINLSDQTDITDLFGTDLPTEDGSFTFKEGVFLTAWKNGDWILLDELNLAPQPVLEGLNACLDHRGEIYIPELGKSFTVKQDTRLFACQNPLKQGGARRGLPLSFLNRFTQVYIDTLTSDDLMFIAKSQYPTIPTDILEKIVKFNCRISHEITFLQLWGHKGGPWEMNFRDIQRWCDALLSDQTDGCINLKPGKVVDLLYITRMRSEEDRNKIIGIYKEIFYPDYPLSALNPMLYVNDKNIFIGDVSVERREESTSKIIKNNLLILRSQLPTVKSLVRCVKMNWLSILVGPAATGKSDLVQSLAALLGHELKILPVTSAMDVTDLLGGFEQVDYNRNLETIFTAVEEIGIETIKHHCLEGAFDDASHLMKEFYKYKQLDVRENDEAHTLGAETSIFKEKAAFLLDTCKNLSKWNKDNETVTRKLDVLIQRVISLTRIVTDLNTVNAGGKFEWVDSLLVKSILEGSWLLMDNVNLTSSAVLDRLNSLLEPNGVLSIPERGENSELKPHPDFRIFFTMDPKYGEISRAMRNRGVEIYILQAEEYGQSIVDKLPYLDLTALISSTGLPSIYHTMCVTAHESMSSYIQGLEKPNLPHLLQAAYLTQQQLVRGIALTTAVVNSFSDVYVKPRCGADFSSDSGDLAYVKNLMLKNLRDIVHTHTQDENTLKNLTNSDHTLKVPELVKNSSYEMVKQTSFWPVQIYTNYVKTIKHFEQFFHHLFVCYQSTPKSDLKLLNKHIHLMITTSSNKVNTKAAFAINDTAFRTTTSLQGTGHLTTPADPRFYPEIIQQVGEADTNCINKHMILLYFTLLKTQTMINMQTPRTQFSALDYASKVADGTLSDDFAEYPVLKYCKKIIDAFDLHFCKIFKLENTVLSNETCIKLLQALNWRSRFVKICHLPIFTQTPGEKSLPKLNEDMVIRINLHLYWLKKHIEENVSLLTEDEIGDEFLRLLENFKLTDSTSKSPLLHISKGLRKRIGQPLLKADEGDYQRAKSRSQLLDQLSFTRIAPKTLSVVHVAGDISLHKHILYNLTTLSDECDVEFCDNLQLAIVDIIKQEKTNPSVLTDSKVQMRPLNSYIILKAIGLLENQILSILHNSPNVDINYDLLTQNNTFKFNKDLFTHTTHTCMEINTVPPALSNLLMYFDKKSDPNLSIDTFGTFSSIYSQFWDNLYNYAEVSPATNPIPYFTWTSSKQTSDKEIAIEVQGAPLKELSVTTPLLVPYVLKLAGGALENAGNITLTCPTVSIEHSENYKQILDNLLTVLWKNLGVLEISNMTQTISNATLAIRNYEFTLLMLTLSLKKYIPESEPEIQYTTEECTAVCQKCFTNFFDSRTSEELIQLLNEGTELFDSVKSIISNRGDKCCNSNVIEELNLKIMSTRLSVIRSIWLVRLMTEINIVDPVEKNALKLNYIDEDIEYLNSLLNAYYLQGIVTGSVLNKSGEIILKTTNNIFEGIEDEDNIKEMSSDCEVVHPFCKLLVDAREQTRNTIKKYAYGHTYRPESPSYLTFAKDCKHFATTLISAPVIMVHYNRLSDLFANLNKALLNEINLKLYVDNGKNTLNKITTWLYSTKSFYEQVREQYSDAFPDLALPLMSAIAHIRHSMKGLADIGREIITKIELAGSKISSINMLVEDLIRFPSMTRRCEDSLEFVQGFCSDDFTKLLNRPNVLTGSLPQVESFRMLKMTLQECKNYCSSLGMLSENSLNCVSSALDALVGIWEQQVKVIKQKEMDEDNLYVTKSKCETVDEETQIINEISEMFPSYADQDFYEFKGPTLEQKIIPKLKENKLTDSEIDIISPDDITMIYKWHSEFIQTFTRAEWLKRDKGKTGFDHLSPLFERYKIFNNLMDNIFWALDSKLEGAVSPSLMVLISEVKKEISGDAELMSSSKPDFYIAPWVQEVRQCLPVLKHVEEHTNDLLNQWPDFPTLKDIMVIVRRLLDFPVTSPIARFLTGIELLREKLQEWNKNAHKGNNLMESSLMVAQIIINWRKLEMSHWKESLNSVMKTKQSESHKYWFYMFDVIMSYIKTDVESDLSTRESELEAVLQQFIEKANLAEFEVRLDILFSFHCHAVNMERSKRRDKIIAILWNIYKYYSQFSTQVSNHIKEKRAPIEKKLRDYVKITSWDRDLSYWSVRDTVIKAYKVLHKHIKEFEKVLKEPASTCFFINPVLDAASNHLGLWDRPKRNSTSPLLGSGGSYMVDLPIYLSRNIKKYFETEIEGLGGLATGKASLLQKAPTLFNKAKKLCKETILQAPYPILVQSLDDFVTDVIEVSAHLGSLEVPTDVPKQKQVSQAKNFLQQKRKALSDLFKTLQRMGLSYKLGLALLNKKEQLEDFTAAPLDVEVALSYLKHSRRSDASMSSVWTGCEMYFQRNIARQRHLFAALRTPAADLGAQNADRCKGYAANLLDLTQHQKSNITQNMRDMCNLRVLLNNVNAMLEQPSSVARQPDLRHSTLQLNRLCANILITLQQFHVLLNSCPQKTNVLNETEPNYDALLSDSPVVKCYKYSDAWTKLYDRVKILITSTNKQSAILQKSLTHLPSVYDADLNLEETMLPFINIDIVNEAIQHINSVKEEILIMVSEYEFKFKSSEVERFQPEHPLLRSLSELVYIINDVLRSINEETFSKSVENENKYGFHDFAKESDELIESILLVIQKIYKRHLPENADKIADSSRIEENGITNGVEETEQQIGDNLDESDKYTIWEKHLKLYLQELLSSDVQDLSVNKIVCESAKLVSAFTQFGADSEQQDSFQSVLSRLVPMLEQLALFVQYFVTQQVAAHRVSCKMLSVMLKIFMDLATKGFCKPAGLDLDEGEGEGGPGRLSGGTGLGEGEGKTDVSDQIENQDQLDDAKRPEDYDKKEEDKDCKEEEKGVNMTDDFDSHLQNVDKKEGDGNSDEEEDENPDKQMGDTEPGADRLDQQIWGSDDEDEDSENEEQNKKDQEEKGTGESVGEKEMAAKEDKDNEKAEEDEGGKKDKKKKEKDINKMDEPEIDDDHIDPYHGNEPQLPEPEDLDLPDNMNLDDDNQDDLEGETESENPFEIDKMTDQPEMEDKEQEEEQKEGEGKSTADKKEEHGQELSSDEEEDGDKDADEGDSKMDVDEDGDTGDKEEEEEEKSTEDGGKDAGQDEEQPQEEDGTEPDTLPQVSGQPDEPIQEEEKEEGQETPEENEKIEENPQANPSLDKPTPENNAESADTDKGTDDNIQTNPDIEKDEEAAPYEQAQEQDGDERNATGQAEVNESQSGHQGPRDREKDTAQLRQDKRPRDKEQNKQRNKPGETEQNRTLGEVQEPAQKKMKTLNLQGEDNSKDEEKEDEGVGENEEEEKEADMYQHIKQANKKDVQVMDAATREQAEEQPCPNKDDEEVTDEPKPDEDIEMDVEDTRGEEELVPEQLLSEKVETKNKDKKKPEVGGEDAVTGETSVEVEGDNVATENVPRGAENTYHTNYEDASSMSYQELDMPLEQSMSLRQWLTCAGGAGAGASAGAGAGVWRDLWQQTSGQARQLSERLRLVLEPTGRSRLAGDFRTGRRINMRRVIPYIASHFRKDRIWLRRTKPAKRNYHIAVAVDDSSSMADNRSKELAFESLALVSQALNLLESGDLAVLSFGENPQVLHPFTEQFSEQSGAKILDKLLFNQTKTKIAQLVDFASVLFEQQTNTSDAVNAKLLVVVSDGCGIFSEGEAKVVQAVRRAKQLGIFLVYVIIDNPDNKDSIMDIRRPMFNPVTGALDCFTSYLDTFPFPFYLILRDITALPTVLGDALRQWFELAANNTHSI